MIYKENAMLIIKFLKKYYNKCRYKIVLKQLSLLSKLKPNRSILRDLVDILEDTDIVEYQTIYGMSRYLSFSDNDLDTLVSRLKNVNQQISIGNIIPISIVTKTKSTKSLDMYLSSNDGYYVDINKSINEYVKHCKTLCIITANYDTADTGIEFRNMMLLTDMFIELRELTKVLIEMRLN